MTIEGVEAHPELARIQRPLWIMAVHHGLLFSGHDGMSTVALLQKYPKPTEEEI